MYPLGKLTLPYGLCTMHLPSEWRIFTSYPSIVPTGEGDIPTSSHSFLLLWKIKVKNFHQPATAASSEDLLLPPLEKRGKRKHRTEMFLEPPQFMYNFVSLAL